MQLRTVNPKIAASSRHLVIGFKHCDELGNEIEM